LIVDGQIKENGMFQIDKDIPVPLTAIGGGQGRPPKYPFEKLSVGESFLAHNETMKRVSNSASMYGRTHGIKFACRTVEGGVRVWRVA
jgi:hypothetical protein